MPPIPILIGAVRRRGRASSRAIAAELDELPMPYKYDVQPFDLIKLRPLREHIQRVGIMGLSCDGKMKIARGNP